MTTSSVAHTRSMSLPSISRKNSFCTAAITLLTASMGTAKQMACSEEACEMSETLVPVEAMAANMRAATPGTPNMPRPSRVISLSPRMVVTDLTTLPLLTGLSATRRVPG